MHTADIYREGLSQREVGTEAFTEAVIERLGAEPSTLKPVRYQASGIHVEPSPTTEQEKVLRGVDVFIDWDGAGRDPNVIGQGLENAAKNVNWQLKMITNRGVKVYPGGLPETFWTDHWRCRFLPADADAITFDRVLDLLGALYEADWDVIKTEHLYTFDGRRAYSLGQGE
jgi:isocitrate dehydrogenase